MTTEFIAAYSGPGPAPAGALYLAVRCREVMLAESGLISVAPRFPQRPRWHLGAIEGAPVYAELAAAADPAPAGAQWVGLRAELARAEAASFELLARAAALWHFCDSHRFCGHCGAATAPDPIEMAMRCSACERLFYPQVAPCVMGLVVDGERVLLGHNARFAEGVYSTLAGFVEVGESAEAALAREVLEETGVVIAPDSSRLIASQAWPFPSQLMLGFTARAQTTDIRVDGVEIVHAAWFHRHQLPSIPPAFTLSGQLIRRFADGELAG